MAQFAYLGKAHEGPGLGVAAGPVPGSGVQPGVQGGGPHPHHQVRPRPRLSAALQTGHAVLGVQRDGEPAGGVQRTVLRDHLQRPGGLHVVVAAPEAGPAVDVDVSADTEIVQGIREEYPLVLHFENPPGQPGVVLVVLSAEQLPHPEMLNEVGGCPGGELK